jgi:CDP-L-myo-inositol myo-inositolphosphotransferase
VKCLIIAAGKGSRISKKGDSKPLIPLLGLPLLERVILAAKKAGLDDFYVVTGYSGGKVRKHLEHFSKNRNVNIKNIVNDEWEKGNGISVLKAKDMLKENFILLMADHIFDESILMKLKNERIKNDEVMLTVDYNVENNEFVDVDDATKVFVKANKILDIGKNIKKYNSYDTGIFLCSPAIFNAIEESLHNGDDSLSGGIKIMANNGKAKTFDIKKAYWVDIDDEKTFKKTEKKLLDNLKKTSDGPVSRYINRPISTRISKYLVKTNITPNQVSLFSFILCCIAASFFFLGEYPYLLLGGIIAQISSVIDGCDGEIARLRFQETDFGGWFDAVLDRYADAFLLFGLTYYAYFATKNFVLLSNYTYFTNRNFLVLFFGFLAIIGTFMNSYTADKYDGLMKKKIKGYYFRIGRDVRIFIIFLFVILNLPFLAILLIAFLTNAENIRRIVVFYKNR